MSFIDYYALLEIPGHAQAAEIKAAYRTQIAEAHPDKHADSQASVEMAKTLNDARRVLLDSTERVKYDLQRARHCESLRPPKRPAGAHPPPQDRSDNPSRHSQHAPSPPVHRQAPSGGGFFFGLGALLLLGGAAYVASNANEYDRSIGQFRGRDGKFRGSRQFF